MNAFFPIVTFNILPSLISCQIFSTGSFYALTTGQHDEIHGGDNMMTLHEDFFKCGARQSCSDVIRIREIDDEGHAIAVQNVWKKIPNYYAQRNSK